MLEFFRGRVNPKLSAFSPDYSDYEVVRATLGKKNGQAQSNKRRQPMQHDSPVAKRCIGRSVENAECR